MKVLLVRHGERADECGESNDRFDPPLTAQGKAQAASAWSKILGAHEISSLRVYTSSMTRCMETTCGVISSLGSSSSVDLTIVPGLASCAAAINRLGSIRSDDVPARLKSSKEATERGQELSLNSAKVNWGFLDDGTTASSYVGGAEDAWWEEGEKEWVKAMRTVLSHTEEGEGCEVCVVVTHREGIRTLVRMLTAGAQRARTTFCCVASFSGGGAALALEDLTYEDCVAFEEY